VAEIPRVVLDVLGPSGLIAQAIVVVQEGLGPPGIADDTVVGLQAGSADWNGLRDPQEIAVKGMKVG